MSFWVRAGWVGLLAGVGLAAGFAVGVGSAHGQQPGPRDCKIVDADGTVEVWPDCKPPVADKLAPTPTADPNVAKKFPFPGEPAVTPAPANAGGATAGTNANGLPPAKQFPFPGEQSDGDAPAPGAIAPVAGTGGGLQDAGSSGSSSSSDSSSGATLPPESGSAGPLGDDDPAARAAAARKADRHKLPAAARLSPDEREQEDLRVAEFYMDDKNYRGAYLRASDAVDAAANDADAHFALAEAARRLGKLDEAMLHYKKCLTLDPVPKVKKAADVALKQMAGG